jgi:HemY protein
MKRLLFYAIVIILAVWVGVLLNHDPGYVMFAYGRWSLETSFWFFLIGAAILFVLFYWLINALRGIKRAPGSITRWHHKHRTQRAHSQTSDGMLALQEGEWKDAEYMLIRGAPKSRVPVINFLYAAQAANEQLAYKRRDQYLKNALSIDKGEAIAVLIMKAKLQLEAKQPIEAAETLKKLKRRAPKQASLLKLTFRLHRQNKNWARQIALTPQLRKQKILDEKTLRHYEYTAMTHLLNDENKTLDDIKALWLTLPKPWRTTRARLINIYAQRLVHFDQQELAADVIIEGLKHTWHDELVSTFSTITMQNTSKQLKLIEKWLSAHPDNATLLCTAASVAFHTEQFPLAKQYAERSLQLQKTAQAYALLASICEKLGEQALMISALRQGLQLAESVSL